MKWFYPVAIATTLTVLVLSSCWAIAKIEPQKPGPHLERLNRPKIGPAHYEVRLMVGTGGQYVPYFTHRQPTVDKHNNITFYRADTGMKSVFSGTWYYEEQP